MYPFIILLLISRVRIIVEEKLSITILYLGAFFNEVPEKIVYIKSIPLILYTQQIIAEEQTYVDNLLEIEN